MKTGELPSGPLTTIDDLNRTWLSLERKANLVSPVAAVDSMPALHAISLRAVMIDPSTNNFGQGNEVYRGSRFCEANEVALGGVAIQKISAAAGVQIIERKRLDDRSEPFYCEIEVTIGVRDFDGTWRQVTKARAIDLRDGAPETLKVEKRKEGSNWVKTGKMIPIADSALADRRRHIQSLCETKALYRAIRTILQLKQKYTKSELAKPFVVPKLIPALDPGDPDQKNALIHMALGREASLYGAPTADASARMLKDVTPEASAREDHPDAEVPEELEAPSQEEEGFNEEDFEPVELPEEQIFVCECVCGCQAEISEEVARITSERCGGPRCRTCYPGKSFDLKEHEGIDDLRLPKMPNVTVQRIAAGMKGGKR